VHEKILHAAFVPFGEVKDVNTSINQASQKHNSLGFITFLEHKDVAVASPSTTSSLSASREGTRDGPCSQVSHAHSSSLGKSNALNPRYHTLTKLVLLQYKNAFTIDVSTSVPVRS
jgi:hypothetical protein